MAVLVSLSQSSYAGCTRDDVNYYLAKGFSTDQITTLCDSTQSSHTSTSEQAPASDNKTQRFLREAIKGRNVLLNKTALSYTLKVCIKYGEEDLYGFAPKACPDVRFELALNGLKIKQPEEKLFFRPHELEVTGNISRNIVDGLDTYKLEDQKSILKLLESGNKTIIPIRDDISIEKVFQTLEQLTI